MNNLKAKLKNSKGFTLIEMLIVVAIIAILVAISIPMVNAALERAREATDQANERAALGLAMSEVLANNKLGNTDVPASGKIYATYLILNSKGTFDTGSTTAPSSNPAATAGGSYGKGTAIGDVTTPHAGETIYVEYDVDTGNYDVHWITA